MSVNKPPFAPGDEFTYKNSRYKVKSVRYFDYFEDGNPKWHVLAWRFIKTTQKFSGNAYSYAVSDDMKRA